MAREEVRRDGGAMNKDCDPDDCVDEGYGESLRNSELSMDTDAISFKSGKTDRPTMPSKPCTASVDRLDSVGNSDCTNSFDSDYYGSLPSSEASASHSSSEGSKFTQSNREILRLPDPYSSNLPISDLRTSNPPSLNSDTSDSKHISDSGYSSKDSKSSSLSSHGPSSSLPTTLNEPSKTLWQGTVENFVFNLVKNPWIKWNPLTDIKHRLDHHQLEELRLLLWEKDAENDNEFEALSAARECDEAIVALAVFTAKNHKQLNTMNSDRQTILHIAAACCSANLVRLIITRGADGAIPDVWGDTPLHIAAEKGKADVIKALTTTLTKPEVKHPYYRVPYKSLPQDNVQSYNHDGRTPVHLAAQVPNSRPHREALRALAKHARADMDYRRLGDGYAPSHIAIDNHDLECLRVCLELDADSEVRNFKSETPQQLAHLSHNKEMVTLCQNFGAGKYQLEFAETEPVYADEEDMEVEEQVSDSALAGEMNRMGLR